jgi:hypothetical protein
LGIAQHAYTRVSLQLTCTGLEFASTICSTGIERCFSNVSADTSVKKEGSVA